MRGQARRPGFRRLSCPRRNDFYVTSTGSPGVCFATTARGRASLGTWPKPLIPTRFAFARSNGTSLTCLQVKHMMLLLRFANDRQSGSFFSWLAYC